MSKNGSFPRFVVGWRVLKAHEVWQPLRRRDYHALRSLSGVAPVTRRSGKTCVVVRRYACNKRLANALYHWARLATQHDALSRRRYAALRQAATATAAPCAPSPTACCRWPAPCSNSRRCSTPATRFATPPAREPPPPIPLFDRKPPSLRPDLPPGRAPRAVAVKDAAANAAASAEPAQSVLDRASTVLPLPWRPRITGCRAGLPPALFR